MQTMESSAIMLYPVENDFLETTETERKAGRRKKTEAQKLLEEKRMLGWLLKMYDERGRMPLWNQIRREYPEEAQEIQRIFGFWESAKTKLSLMIKAREEKEKELRLAEQQRLARRTYGSTYSLEDYLQGILLVQEHLKIKRMPSLREIDSVAKELGLPSGISFSRKLFHKEYWAGFVNRYNEASRLEREVVLEEIEAELNQLKKAELQETKAQKRARGEKVRPDKLEYTREDCLRTLLRMCQYYGRMPSNRQVEEHNRIFKSISKKALLRHLGPKDTWEPQLTEYKHQRSIDAYLRRCNELTKGEPIDLKAIAGMVEQFASEGDKLEFRTLLEKLEKATLKAPATFCLKLGERKFEITAKPR